MFTIYCEFFPEEVLLDGFDVNTPSDEELEKLNDYYKINNSQRIDIMDTALGVVRKLNNSVSSIAENIDLSRNDIFVPCAEMVPTACIDEGSRKYVIDTIKNIVEDKVVTSDGACIIGKRVVKTMLDQTIARVGDFVANYNDEMGLHAFVIDEEPIKFILKVPVKSKKTSKSVQEEVVVPEVTIEETAVDESKETIVEEVNNG